MSAIDQQFAKLKTAGKKAFVPFVTAGDPSLEMTAEAIKQLASSGAALIEVGIPYSDPIADGPVIQASYSRALDAGITLKKTFQMISQVSREVDIPLACMVSYSIILRVGPEQFVADAVAAGFSGAIVPDLLVEEADAFRQTCKQHDFSLVHLVTPTTPPERMLQIAESSTGFLYFVSITGITGERTELPADLTDKVAWLRERTELPICIGFGISQPEHAQKLAPVADGLIVGSAIVRRLADSADQQTALKEIGNLTCDIIAAM
ncbi:MAG: tryptophan synthase subunit alpha [Aureliella sp.]